MSEEQQNKPGTGALFKSQHKKTKKHPDYVGRINIDGVDHWLSAWVKKSQAGDVYMSLSMGEACDAPISDDDIPF